MPELEFGADHLELVEEMRLIGVIIQSDMKWTSNTESIIKRASNKLWVVRRLKALGSQTDDLVDMFVKQYMSILELAVPAWHGAITVVERQDIERVQKVGLHLILGDQYENYGNALKLTNLETLEARRHKLCLKFGKKAEKNENHKNWFKLKPIVNTRQGDEKYWNGIGMQNQ